MQQHMMYQHMMYQQLLHIHKNVDTVESVVMCGDTLNSHIYVEREIKRETKKETKKKITNSKIRSTAHLPAKCSKYAPRTYKLMKKCDIYYNVNPQNIYVPKGYTLVQHKLVLNRSNVNHYRLGR